MAQWTRQNQARVRHSIDIHDLWALSWGGPGFANLRTIRPSSFFTAFIKRWEWTGNDLLNENVLLISWFPSQIKVIYSFSSSIHSLHLFNEINSREAPAKASPWISIPRHKWTPPARLHLSALISRKPLNTLPMQQAAQTRNFCYLSREHFPSPLHRPDHRVTQSSRQ